MDIKKIKELVKIMEALPHELTVKDAETEISLS
jgi:hypothetical protein